RTFSKVYGMAGIRCGYGIAQRSLIQRMDQQKAWDSMNVVALAGARASLLDANHVAIGRKRNSDTRQQVVNILTKLGYEVLPSQANFFMVDVKRPVKPVIAALRDRGVHVGRLFPALPQYLRVTVGKPDEMDAFASAFRSVMA
ncbi:MAG TPA: aminotransferase class I/II-fold pyridoxal phosphate-dependent enzyme, partial [Thermoanaerobaculia bacterium]|nr:aminotransferase class I/II-fold pyridoxal phosphate-dependent enzyme [Thermoanaerobaculia bacterium]